MENLNNLNGKIFKKNLSVVLNEAHLSGAGADRSSFINNDPARHQENMDVGGYGLLGAASLGALGAGIGMTDADSENFEALKEYQNQVGSKIDPEVLKNLEKINNNEPSILNFYDKSNSIDGYLDKFKDYNENFKDKIGNYDTNHNGLIDKDELDKLKKDYTKELEKSKIGKIDIDDINNAEDLEKAQKPFKKLDINNDGKINATDEKILKNFKNYEDKTSSSVLKGLGYGAAGALGGGMLFSSLAQRIRSQEEEEKMKQMEYMKMLQAQQELDPGFEPGPIVPNMPMPVPDVPGMPMQPQQPVQLPLQISSNDIRHELASIR